MDKKRFKKNLHDTKMGRFGRPAEDDNKKKKTSHLNAVFLVKLFQPVKRLSSLQRHFSIF